MKHLPSVAACGAALAIATVVPAFAVQYPPGPGDICPDTLTVHHVQDPASAPCFPASGDTVHGVRGIVTGFDQIPSAFAFWIQLADGSPFSGVQVFTGAANYAGPLPGTPSGGSLALGDLVVVYGRKLEFSNVTEITDYDGAQGTNDIVVRRLSSGNPQPPYHLGTPTTLNWVPAAPGNLSESYEGMLVRIRGPLRVGRNAGPGIGSRSFLVTLPLVPGDSAAVDGFNLTNVPAPPVGTVVDSVQGILHQSTINGISSYRIQLRGPEDLFVAAPPSLTDAYPVEDNLLRLVFDRDVTESSAENLANYSLSSFGLVNAATLLGGAGRVVELNITNGLAAGDLEGVTASNIVSTSGLLMPSPQSRAFINGVLTLASIQAPDPAALGPPCDDRSRFTGPDGVSGPRLTYRGIVTAQFGAVSYLSDALNPGDSGVRAGMPVFGSPVPLQLGRKYLIAGEVHEFDGISATIPDGLTEGVGTVFVRDEGPATVPDPRLQTLAVLRDTTCDATQSLLNAEDFEGVLVRVEHARIAEERTAGQSFLIAVGPDTLLVANPDNVYAFDPDSGVFVSISGVLTFRNGTRPFRLLPRGDHDFDVSGDIIVDGSYDIRDPVLLAMNPMDVVFDRDSVELVVYLRNIGAQPHSNVSLTVGSSHVALTILTPTVPVGDLVPGSWGKATVLLKTNSAPAGLHRLPLLITSSMASIADTLPLLVVRDTPDTILHYGAGSTARDSVIFKLSSDDGDYTIIEVTDRTPPSSVYSSVCNTTRLRRVMVTYTPCTPYAGIHPPATCVSREYMATSGSEPRWEIQDERNWEKKVLIAVASALGFTYLEAEKAAGTGITILIKELGWKGAVKRIVGRIAGWWAVAFSLCVGIVNAVAADPPVGDVFFVGEEMTPPPLGALTLEERCEIDIFDQEGTCEDDLTMSGVRTFERITDQGTLTYVQPFSITVPFATALSPVLNQGSYRSGDSLIARVAASAATGTVRGHQGAVQAVAWPGTQLASGFGFPLWDDGRGADVAANDGVFSGARILSPADLAGAGNLTMRFTLAQQDRSAVPPVPAVGCAALSAVVSAEPAAISNAARLGIAPNPANGSVRISYTVSERAPTRLEIFDLQGRLVRNLIEGSPSIGRHEVVWDRRDRHGRGVRPGLYLCRLTVGGRVDRAPVLVVR